MRILFLTDNFPPEGNAPASRTYEHAVRWVRAGHEVTVITGAPNFPEGVLFSGYKNRWYSVEEMSGVRVVRVKTYITANEGFARRTLDYISFMVSSFLAGLVQPRPDVILGTSPQFFTVCSAWMLSVFRWRPFVFELRDLWPASIKAVGAMRESRALAALERLEAFLYRKATAIVAVTDAFRRELIERGVDQDKIAVVINGVDSSVYRPKARDQSMAEAFGTDGRFVVGYIGTHGMAHALHVVLEAADRLRTEEGVLFLLVGGGAQRDSLVRRAADMQLENVRFVERQPKEKMPDIWALCDVALVQLKDDPLFRSVIPSKIFEAMGMGLPILIAVPEGEATTIVASTGAGMVIAPEDSEALAAAVLDLYRNDELRCLLATASAAAAERFSRDRQASRMLEVLQAVAEGRASTVGGYAGYGASGGG